MDQGKPRSGMRLNHYALTVKLSEGIFSETWLAEHAYLENKEICLKIFTDQKFCDFLKKQKLLAVFRDPLHLPHIEDYDPNSDPPYIAQEVVAGRSLRQLLRMQKKFPADSAFEIIVRTTHALRKIHDQNAAHLDLRPEHLMLDEKNNIKLMDYLIGRVTTLTLASYYREFTEKGIELPKPLMRSLLYKPKNQRIGQDLGVSADIFALGILLFELVTGTYPSRKTPLPTAFAPELPAKIDHIYKRCCGRDAQLFENCQEVVDAIYAKEDIQDVVSGLSGVKLITENIAVVSLTAMAGNKHYVDGKNVTMLSKNLDSLTSTPLRFIIFDLQNIDYLNSSAIGFLVNLSDRMQNKQGATVMCNVDKKVFTILSALGLEKIMQICPSLEDAQQYLLGVVNPN